MPVGGVWRIRKKTPSNNIIFPVSDKSKESDCCAVNAKVRLQAGMEALGE